MGIHFVVEQTPTGEWVSHLDNADWVSGGNATWVTDHWVFALTGGPTQGTLDELGTWVEGFRPTKMRVTLSGNYDDTGDLYLIGNGGGEEGGTIVSQVDYVSLQELDLPFTLDEDIFRLYLLMESSAYTINVDDIEFWVPAA